MDVHLVLLPDLKPQIFDEDVDKCHGNVIQAGVESGHKAGIKWNQIHPS